MKRIFGIVFIVLVLLGALDLQHQKYEEGFDTWDYYRQEEGWFSMEYRNDFELKERSGVYYLKPILSDQVVFHLFPDEAGFVFDPEDYVCEQGFCYSKVNTEGFLRNLEFNLGLEEDKFELVNRAEALGLILESRYPEEDFVEYAASCFEDLVGDEWYAGHVCYAKDKGIVTGIGGLFYPESTINIWGILKISFKVYGIDDYEFEDKYVDSKIFELMTPYHESYGLFAKAYYEGVLLNVSRKDVWRNRVVYKAEMRNILERFQAWRSGKVLRRYEEVEDLVLDKVEDLYFDPEEVLGEFILVEKDGFKEDEPGKKVKLKASVGGLKVYMSEDGNVYELLGIIHGLEYEEVKDSELFYDEERRRGSLKLYLKDGDKKYYIFQVKREDFAYFKEESAFILDDPNLLPNELENIDLPEVTKVSLFLRNEDFEKILKDRTLLTRYPVWVELDYLDETVESFSALVKTRGNANRGYIKSSYTIESFDNLLGGPSLEFLEGRDEFKLRSLISDPTMMREKLVYTFFRNMGNVAPEFGEVFLEVNGIPFGFYQLTEAVKDDFFEDRSLEPEAVYARNVSLEYSSDFSYHEDEDIIGSQYKINGDKKFQEEFIQFLYRLEKQDLSLLPEIDQQGVFEYALTVYVFGLTDSLVHNNYLYKQGGKWSLFLWDADEAFYKIPEINKEAFKFFVKEGDARQNKLLRFVFDKMSDEEFDLLWEESLFKLRDLDLRGPLDYYTEKYTQFYSYDNDLWNGRYLEREEPFIDTLEEIEKLKQSLGLLQEGLLKLGS